MSYDRKKADQGARREPALRYLETLFGKPARQAPWAGAASLPAYLASQYRCVEVSVDGTDVLLAEPAGAAPTPAVLEKQLAALKARYKGPVAVFLPAIDPVARSRLLARRIPFIVPDQQLYFPELGLALRERFGAAASQAETLQPAAQHLIVLLLMGMLPATASVSEIAAGTGYTAMTASRILSALEAAGAAESARLGRERRMAAPPSRRALWERAMPLMGSPVQRTLFLRGGSPPEAALEAGYLALSRMGELAEPARREYAIDGAAAATLLKAGRLVTTDSGEDADALMQVWSYPPIPAREGRWVNPFSLYLSLKGDEDERVRKELAALLEGQWSRE
jgi:DNA-binding MarR family transcriptional regulator